MSVSFAPEFVDAGQYVLRCACGGARGATVYSSFKAARAAAQEGIRVSCGDVYCAADGWVSPVQLVEDPEVNVSNANASTLLDVLGIQVGERFEDRCCGMLDAEDFLGRVLVARAVNPVDAGVPAVSEGNFIDCGRSEGYVDVRLEQLQVVAEFAVRAGLRVHWG